MIVAVVAAVIERDGRFLVTRRLAGTHLEGCWEFPGGKVEEGEGDAESLARELREELDVAAHVGRLILTTGHAYAERTVELRFYECTLVGEPRPILGQEVRWVDRDELASLSFPPADAELIARLTEPSDDVPV